MPAGDGFLSPAEFAATAAAKRGGTYQGYRSYVTRTRAKRAAVRRARQADPFAATPEPEIRARIEAAIKAQVDPVVARIKADTDREAGNIDALTQRYASRLEPFAGATRDRFTRAQTQAAAVADALANRLGTAGAAAESDLSGKLGAINAPDRLVSEIAGGAGQFGRGAANAGFAIDSSALEELISRGAGAEDFSAALPGFANLEGIGQIGRVRGEAQRDIRDLQAGIPKLFQELLAEERDREFDKGLARDVVQRDEADRKLKYEELYSDTLAQANAQLAEEQKGRQAARGEAVKARGDAIEKAISTAQTRARELRLGRETVNPYGKKSYTPIDRAKATEIILSEIAGPLARYGVKPGTDLWQKVRLAVIDALTNAGFRTGIAADPTKPNRYGPPDKKRG